jgi:hypothetical protein
MGLWTEGVAGMFDLDIMWIGAGNISSASIPPSRNVCSGKLQSNLRFNVSGRLAADYLPLPTTPGETLAGAVCCDPFFKQYAEPNSFFERSDVDMFDSLDDSATTTFYDSVCGIPLFKAPIGRTFAEWKAESINYGWPSFREQELVKGNVMTLKTGEVVSKCGTHLGSYLPDSKGSRYCTDMVCVSGHAAAGIVAKQEQSKLLATFDGAAGTTFPWVTVNDPVMGGQSNSTLQISHTTGTALWHGEVKIVPFLHAPGFCKAQCPALGKTVQIPSAVGYDGITVSLRNLDSTGLSAFNVVIESTGAKSIFGQRGAYTADFNVTATGDKTFTSSFMPWSAFTCTWRGQKVTWCPDLTTQLDKMDSLSVGTAFPGKAGPFQVEIKSIAASMQ